MIGSLCCWRGNQVQTTRRCECGCKCFYFSHLKRRLQGDAAHNLCKRCFRAACNKMRSLRLKQEQCQLAVS